CTTLDERDDPTVKVSLQELRERIDAIDDAILDLIEQRARTAEEVGRVKQSSGRSMHDPEREQRIFERLEKKHADGGNVFPRSSLRPVFREIISACSSMEQEVTVSYLAPPGTFTHMAAL